MINFNNDKNKERLSFIQYRLKELSNDFIQAQIGAHIDNLDKKREEFISLHNELREMLGKTPRIYTL